MDKEELNFVVPWSEDPKYQGDLYEVIEEAVKSLAEYKHQPINFIYTEGMKKFDERLHLTLKNIPDAELEKFKDDFLAAGTRSVGIDPTRENNRINIYTCTSGHDTITRDLDHGTTPMFLGCKTCGKQATSHMYRCDQTLTPLWEWYAPNPADCADYEMDHVLLGGLLLRPVSDAQPTATLSKTQLKTMYEFNRNWKRKNPGWTARQFKRAFLKMFPNNVK